MVFACCWGDRVGAAKCEKSPDTPQRAVCRAPSSYRSFANTAKTKENAIALIMKCMTSPH
jgi:hypothetical protein